ncbi:MAG TPA: MBL fold metallo-hydrolase [Micromonosporaceae bacterium]|jgi:L-ascorbate metabolism protein UlaG (beta-lactamase superfamily)|nr:MBL fold metallo-hydrolase [Micromonosporaceae bacterium]
MKVTKYTHACIRLEHDGRVLVIDPGVWSEPSALDGADAVLVTHQHGDHVDVLRLAGLGAPVYAPTDAAITGVEPIRVNTGDEFTAAGFRITAVGGRHAFIYGGSPDCANLGYIVDGSLYHPGDSLFVPDQPVETLCVPVHGSWMKTNEAIDFVKAVNPVRTFPIHDAQLNERGIGGANAWIGDETTNGYRYLAPEESVDC